MIAVSSDRGVVDGIVRKEVGGDLSPREMWI